MTPQEIEKLPQEVRQFLSYEEAIRGKSKLTILEYASDLRTFFRYLKIVRGLVSPTLPEEKIDLTDITLDFIRSVTLNDAYNFLIYCKNDRENNEKTRARKVSTLRSFFHYLTVKMGKLDIDPMLNLDTPKTKKSLPKYLTLEESRQLLGSVSGKYKERDYCILTLFLNCGLRLAELVSIDYTDVRENRTLRVVGKGNKERTIYLNDACMEALKAYMKVRPVDGVKDRKALFLSARLQRISPKTVQHMVNTALETAGLADRGFSVHKLRHTAATLMYQHGHVDVLILKEILGHENLGTTEIYTHLVDEQLEKAADANPLAKMHPPKSKDEQGG